MSVQQAAMTGKFFKRLRALGAIAAGLVTLAAADGALAGTTWDGLKTEVYGTRPILPGAGIVLLKAPTRPEDQRAVPIAIEADFRDGRTVKAVTFVVDENPSPIAAVFRIEQLRSHVALAAKFRLNAETDVRAVVEASDGALYMVSQHVKFAGGQAACSAPPSGDPKEIAENMGKMKLAQKLEASPAAMSALNTRVRLDISHPNHTGMVLDQQTLLYVPLKMVTDVAVTVGDERVFSMSGSITLAQDPSIEFDYKQNGADKLVAHVRDSDNSEWSQSFPVGQGS